MSDYIIINTEVLPYLVMSGFIAFLCLGLGIWLNIHMEDKYAQFFEI